jgi:hypothetical protein
MRVNDVASNIFQALDLGKEEPLGSFVTTAEPGAEAAGVEAAGVEATEVEATDATVTPPTTLELEAGLTGGGATAGAADVDDTAAPVSKTDLEARLAAAANAAKTLHDEADGMALTPPISAVCSPCTGLHGRRQSSQRCLLIVYRCTRTRTHSPHPPWPGLDIRFLRSQSHTHCQRMARPWGGAS